MKESRYASRGESYGLEADTDMVAGSTSHSETGPPRVIHLAFSRAAAR